MDCSKSHIICGAIFFLLAGCSAAPISKTKTVVTSKPAEFQPIDIPSAIAKGERSRWEKVLVLLPVDHPKRLALRDRLIESLASEFSTLPEEDPAERLKLFEQALSWHDAADFTWNRVSEAVTPMAKWITAAYEKRGDEAIVLASLRFLMLASPDDVAVKDRYFQLVEWAESIRMIMEDPLERLDSSINMYRRMVQLVPDRQVVERLAEAYVERHQTLMSIYDNATAEGERQLHPFEMLLQGRAQQELPINLIYIFFLTGDPAGARQHLATVVAEGGVRAEFLDLLDKIFQGIDTAENYYILSKYLAPIDSRARLKACILARAAAPRDPRFPMCIGRAFEQLKLPECAFEFYAEAVQDKASEEVYAEVLALYMRALETIHRNENNGESQKHIALGQRIIDGALRLKPSEDSDLLAVIATFLFEIGYIEFDNGDIAEAKKHFEQSFEKMPNVRAIIQLAEIHRLLGEYQQGLAMLDRADRAALKGQRPGGYWSASLFEKRADLLTALGKTDYAAKFYQLALDEWEKADITAEQAPEVAERRGMILDKLGYVKESQEAFRLAVRLDPSKQQTYAHLLSFLVARARLDDAKEFYELAYNQDQIEGMWKIYFSLWIEGLSRRLGKGSVPLARGYLEDSRGETWQDKLARYFAGEMTRDNLSSAAANRGQTIEVAYYTALLDLAEGKKDEARQKLQKVIDSQLLGFFEYSMALAILQDELSVSLRKE